MNDLQNAEEQIKHMLPRIFEFYGVQPDRRAGHGMYKCPFCGSGSGTGATHNGALSIKGDFWKCFACNRQGDAFDFVGYEESPAYVPKTGGAEFRHIVERAAEITGVSLPEKGPSDGSAPRSSSKRPPKQERKQEPGGPDLAALNSSTPSTSSPASDPAREATRRGQYKEYVQSCRTPENREKAVEYCAGRGITEETVDRFLLGYDPERDALIIPYGPECSYYSCRYLHPENRNGQRHGKPKTDEAGPEPIFNAPALYGSLPVFVCEGQLDAISVMQAGAGKYAAVAVGNHSISRLVEQARRKEPTAKIILSFDSDKPGEEGTKEAADEMKKAGLFYAVATYSTDKYPAGAKDGNDYLQGNPDAFRADLDRDAALPLLDPFADYDKNPHTAYLTVTYKPETGAEIAKPLAGAMRACFETMNGRAALDSLREDIKTGNTEEPVPTGFSTFDRLLDGGYYPGLILIGAVSSLGKTTLVLQTADQIAQAGGRVLFFSLEMTRRELISKSVSRISYEMSNDPRTAATERGIRVASRYATYSEDRKANIRKAMDAYDTFDDRMTIIEADDMTAEKLVQTVKNYITVYGEKPAAVFLDYLQFLDPADPHGTDKTNTDAAVKILKRAARDLKLPFVVISSFNRENYANDASPAAFKESGSIEYTCDTLIALQPYGMKRAKTKADVADNLDCLENCKRADVRDVEAVILKNRGARPATRARFRYMAAYNSFEEVPATAAPGGPDFNPPVRAEAAADPADHQLTVEEWADGFRNLPDGMELPFQDNELQ